MNVVDSSGWIEYFLDSPCADLFATAIEASQLLVVPVISIYEVYKFLVKQTTDAIAGQCIEVMQRGRVIDFTPTRAIAAAKTAHLYQLAMADAAIYSITLEHKATLWTQDADYQKLPQVQYFSKG
jgi:predicted nucleic acid-binding protein